MPERKSAAGTTYYEISNRKTAPARGLKKADAFDMWEYIRPEILSAIKDFKPDIIQCFGSEWPYGMIAEDADIPVVIHMQGFLNAYSLANKLLPHTDSIRRRISSKIPGNIRKVIRPDQRRTELEKQIMQVNNFFMGRTQWDRRIVRYYSPGAKYYYVPEAIRPAFHDAAGSWKGCAGEENSNVRLLTVSQSSPLKGNEIILYTAKILKEDLGIDFEWRIAGNPEMFKACEKTTGIHHDDVNIELIGWIEQERIISELQDADIFIHPSIIDNSPNAICEAQITGCPVIASNVGGVSSLIEDGVTGYLYPYNEPHTLAFLITELAKQRETLTEISAREAKEAVKRHDPEAIADRVCSVYREIIEEYNAGAREEKV